MGNINDINLNDFPYLDNLDVQKTETNFDYNLWGANTQLYLSHIPAIWNSEYKHTVKFESTAAKTAFFKTNAPIKLSTSFLIRPDGTIKLQIPYNNLINFNYIVAVYPDLPVPGNDLGTIRKEYYYFIEDCKMLSPNTTELRLTLDVWSTYIDDINVNNMRLVRGHYPQTLSNVDSYLANPLQNRLGIGTTDVSFGDLCKIGSYHSYDLLADSTQYVVVATTSNPTTFTDHTTTFNGGTNMERGIYYFAVQVSLWQTFVTNTMANTPAFFQTIVGIMMVNSKYVTIGAGYITFNGVVCYIAIEGKLDAINYTFTKADFNYGTDYENLTKLYTFPYAVIEVIDQNGQAQLIKYEDLYVGKFALSIFTKMCIGNHSSKAIVLNVGGDNLQGSFNMYSFDIPIPTSMVNQNGNNAYMLETKYPRIQQQNDINNSYTITGNNADVTSAITKRGNDQSKDFTTHDIDLSLALNLITQKYRRIMNDKQGNMAAFNEQYSAMIDHLAFTLETNAQVMNMAFQSMGVAMDTIKGGATGGPAGAAASLVGAIPGMATASYNLAGGAAMNGATQDYMLQMFEKSSQFNAEVNGSDGYTVDTIYLGNIVGYTQDSKVGLVNQNANEITTDINDVTEYKRDNAYNVAETNRTASYSNTIGNAQLSKANSLTAIDNAINQSYYANNRSYGTPGDVSVYDGYRNIIQYHIKTQSPDAIKQAGDIFLRYGYAYDGNVPFNTFNVMPKFTYWQVEDVWLDSEKVNNSIMKTLTGILKDGITVWKNPTDVGKITIYNNKN